MIGRRKALAGTAAIVVAGGLANEAHAYEKCMATPQYGKVCEAGVEISKVVEAYDDQNCSQWCWAASISMVFAHYGYHIEQARLVKEAYGAVVNMGAVGTTITKALNRTWTDDGGNKFRVQVDGLYDFDTGTVGITDPQILAALKAERPLLFGNQSHAMMLFSAAYVQTPYGPRIVNLGFADPWPGMGLRPPKMGEAYPMHMGGGMRYLALPRVTPV